MTQDKQKAKGSLRTDQDKLMFGQGFSFSGYERDPLFLNLGNRKFVDISGCSGIDSVTDGRAGVFADFDNDGDLDVFIDHDPGPVAPALPQQRGPGRPLAARGARGRAVARPRRVLVGRARAHVGGDPHQDEGGRERLHLAARPAPAVRPGEGRAGRLRRGHVAGRLGRGLRRAVRGGDDGAPRAGQGAGRGRATRLRAAARPADAGRGDRLRAARQGGPARPRPEVVGLDGRADDAAAAC